MKITSFLLRNSPALLALAVATGIASGALGASLMALVNTRLANIASPIAPIASAFAGVTLLVLISSLSSRLFLLRLSTRAVLALRMRLCQQMLGAPLQQVEQHGPHRMLATLTEDVLAVSDTLAEMPVFCINIAILAAGLSYMVYLSVPLALAFALVFGFGVVSYELIERRTRPHLAQGRELWDTLVGHYQALILGNKELKLHRERRSAFIAEGLRPTALRMRELALRWHTLFAIAAAYGQAFYFVIIGAVLFAAPSFGVNDVTVLTGFTLTILYMNTPISVIIGLLPAFQRASVSLEKIESLGLSLAAAEPAAGADASPRAWQSLTGIEISALRYTYWPDGEDRPFSLGPIDLAISPGELLFITGGNGSGKSSFARLLTGLYAPDSGCIRYNGVPVSDQTRDSYRQKFSAVFSDFYLFDMLFGLVTPDLRRRVEELLEKLKLTGKVSIVQGRFSTVNLSQGQRKRLALLTAFIEDREIYLFDEWAADQDPSFKEVFYRKILPELKARGKTVIVISHDDHYYEVADRVLKFEDGVIVEGHAARPMLSSELAAVVS